MDIPSFSNQPKNMEFRPRVHGNGFIQLDLTPTRRLHIWGHPDIPHQDPFTPIHNHQFGFTSRVILGRIRNTMYEAHARSNGSHGIYTARVRDREDTILEYTGFRVNIVQIADGGFGPGERYYMEPGEIHSSMVFDLTATIIDKSGASLSQGGPEPWVFVPEGTEPDNSFNRYSMSEADMWSIISEVLWKGKVNA